MNVLATILTAVITSGLVSAVLNWYIKSKEIGEQRRWEIKREACLDALEIIDARFADYVWLANGTPTKVDSQEYIQTSKIRSCFNRLVLSCNDSNVPQEFEKCLNLDLGKKPTEILTMHSVADLRNAIRKELGFGHKMKTTMDWITYITWKQVKKSDA